MKYPRNKALLKTARNLRKNMTKEERHLWYDLLRYCSPRFRRQEIIGNYIADFFCYEAKILIEVDGSQHFMDAERQHDEKRTDFFESAGISVVRFNNLQVNTEFESVCQNILLLLEQRGVNPLVSFADSSPAGEPREELNR